DGGLSISDVHLGDGMALNGIDGRAARIGGDAGDSGGELSRSGFDEAGDREVRQFSQSLHRGSARGPVDGLKMYGSDGLSQSGALRCSGFAVQRLEQREYVL